jgi:putative salt-induced outer membrane protein
LGILRTIAADPGAADPGSGLHFDDRTRGVSLSGGKTKVREEIRLDCLLTLLRVVLAAGVFLPNGIALAQAPAAAPVYTGSLGGGFALTSGNTDTRNFNLTAEVVRDPGTRNLVKGSASYLRGVQNDILNLDRSSVLLRNEYTLSNRTFAFGQVDYLRDQFKGIIFLWAPTGGIGYKLIETDATEFVLDGGAGAVFEKNPGLDTGKSGSLTAGQSFRQQISTAATLTQSFSALWKTDDFSDSFYNFSVGLSTTLAGNLELKLEFIDSYKNRPTSSALNKNDTAFLTAFVIKF